MQAPGAVRWPDRSGGSGFVDARGEAALQAVRLTGVDGAHLGGAVQGGERIGEGCPGGGFVAGGCGLADAADGGAGE